MLLVEMQAQTIYQMKNQHQLKKNPILNLNKEKQTSIKLPTRSHSKTNNTQNEKAKNKQKKLNNSRKK